METPNLDAILLDCTYHDDGCAAENGPDSDGAFAECDCSLAQAHAELTALTRRCEDLEARLRALVDAREASKAAFLSRDSERMDETMYGFEEAYREAREALRRC